MKPFRVVCVSQGLSGVWTVDYGSPDLGVNDPIKGEIYTVIEIYEYDNRYFYILLECSPIGYNTKNFREVDNTFGEVVCEQIEQIIELEETISI